MTAYKGKFGRYLIAGITSNVVTVLVIVLMAAIVSAIPVDPLMVLYTIALTGIFNALVIVFLSVFRNIEEKSNSVSYLCLFFASLFAIQLTSFLAGAFSGSIGYLVVLNFVINALLVAVITAIVFVIYAKIR